MNLSKARVDPATPDGALSDGLRNHRLNLQPCLEGKGLSWRVCREGELKRVVRLHGRTQGHVRAEHAAPIIQHY